MADVIPYSIFYHAESSGPMADVMLSTINQLIKKDLGFQEKLNLETRSSHPADGCSCTPLEISRTLKCFIRPYKAKEPDLAQIYAFRYFEGDHFVQHLSVAVATEFQKAVKDTFKGTGLETSIHDVLKKVSAEVGKTPMDCNSWLTGFTSVDSYLLPESENYFRELRLRPRRLVSANAFIP